MQQREVSIINKLGLHARAAAKFVTMASGFESEVKLVRDGKEVNGKSIMGVMMLAAAKDTVLQLVVSGPDEQEAMDKLTRLIADRFGETE